MNYKRYVMMLRLSTNRWRHSWTPLGTFHCGNSIFQFPPRSKVLAPPHPKVAAKLMTDAAHYFEASSCLLCSILAVQVRQQFLGSSPSSPNMNE